MNRRTILGGLGAGALAGLVAARAWGSSVVERGLNRTAEDPYAPVPDAEIAAFHRGLFIADLHADTLKWERDMLARSDLGHVDLPRLREGNIALQVFAIVTHSPVNLPWRDCLRAEDPNHAAWLAAAQGRPVRSSRARAYHQIERFHETVQRSRRLSPELLPVMSAGDLAGLVQARADGRDVTGGLVSLEGGHWIGVPDASERAVRAEIDALAAAGLRAFAPVHRFDNALGGSSEGCTRGGLTEAGRIALRAAEENGMVIDLAHASEAAVQDAARLLREPFIVSHTGVRATCEGVCRPDRNLSDESIRAILGSGGVIGIGFWTWAVGEGLSNIPRAMGHVMELAARSGLEPSRHVALGSDWDGSVVTQVVPERLPVLTATLDHHGFGRSAIRDVMGRNVVRLMAQRLPGGGAGKADDIVAAIDAHFT